MFGSGACNKHHIVHLLIKQFVQQVYKMSSAFQQAQAEGLCLRYPENLGLHREVSYESAVSMLLRAVSMAQTVPFGWGFVDKPAGKSRINRA